MNDIATNLPWATNLPDNVRDDDPRAPWNIPDLPECSTCFDYFEADPDETLCGECRTIENNKVDA